ncbi:uncharacterized protein I303_106603 [Kwoniella dejecticola CBS 10117]|uniref:CN hydrolase domain-containing protein n=1 Tax=Kwoniella dejecticola CBS 10117 TaxID=1296121 RepID=A0A1A5ZU82_9TREE|nr:uncharacterized protein I303_08139 [Kwoniella dejecticola CBS 10117]OBR81369.1 hypothetical protein I303_08139 [Kwoniella dejecticola CBS 10117]
MPRTKSKITIAAVQAAPVSFDLPATLAKLEDLISKASASASADEAKRPDLVVLPEAFLSAYPRFLDFQIGTRSTESREWFARYVKSSVKIPLDAISSDWISDKPIYEQDQDDFWAFQRLCLIAKKHQIYLSIGVVERELIGSTLYCTNLLFSPSGRLLSKHRKLQPTAAERIVWHQGDDTNPAAPATRDEKGEERQARDDNLPVVETKIGKIGGLICWENFMPLARYQLYRKGVEIYTAPTADSRPTWLPAMQHIAQEGRCFVISVNQYHAPSDFPADYPPSLALSESEKAENKPWSRGGSSIVGPLGEVLAGPLWDKEGILTAEIDLDTLHGARLDFDAAGHYSRHDMMVNLLNKPAYSSKEE